MVRRALIAVEAILAGTFAADAVFGITGQTRATSLLLAVAFVAALAWDLRRE